MFKKCYRRVTIRFAKCCRWGAAQPLCYYVIGIAILSFMTMLPFEPLSLICSSGFRVVAALMSMIFLVVYPYYRRTYWSTWFNSDLEEWVDIKRIFHGQDCWFQNVKKGKLPHSECIVLKRLNLLARDVCIIILAMLLVWWGLYVLVSENLTENLIKHLVDNAAWIAVIPGVIFGVYQLLVKVRSENRQKWMHSVRTLIAILIANIPDSPWGECRENKSKLQNYYTQLELYLNPMEKINLALLYLIDRAYGGRFGNDNVFYKALEIKSAYFRDNERRGMIRLANVLLKREWERIKYIR